MTAFKLKLTRLTVSNAVHADGADGLAHQRRWPLGSVHSCVTGTGSDDVAVRLRRYRIKR